MKKREMMISKFADYKVVLQYYMEKAYDIIYKDQVLTYSLEATRLPEKEYEESLKRFVRLVEKMLGKELQKEFLFLYGDYDTFMFIVAEYYVSKYDSDAIRDAAMDNIVESEADTTEGP
jgi:hypothetical protein